MKGYHYTSKENWEHIQKDGVMKTYKIGKGKRDIEMCFPGGADGVWLWRDDPKGDSHAGNILYQLATKGSPEIVKLEVDYNPDRVLSYKGRFIDLSHEGKIENWRYHSGDKSVIIDGQIPLKDIRLVGSYNTVQRLGG